MLEDRVLEEMEVLVSNDGEWLIRWFVEVKRWSPDMMDVEKVPWLSFWHSLPCLEFKKKKLVHH